MLWPIENRRFVSQDGTSGCDPQKQKTTTEQNLRKYPALSVRVERVYIKGKKTRQV